MTKKMLCATIVLLLIVMTPTLSANEKEVSNFYAQEGVSWVLKVTLPLTSAPKGDMQGINKGPGRKKGTFEEVVKVPAGEFECTVTKATAGGNTSTTWMSKKHNGLMVKQVSETAGTKSTVVLVDFSAGK